MNAKPPQTAKGQKPPPPPDPKAAFKTDKLALNDAQSRGRNMLGSRMTLPAMQVTMGVSNAVSKPPVPPSPPVPGPDGEPLPAEAAPAAPTNARAPGSSTGNPTMKAGNMGTARKATAMDQSYIPGVITADTPLPLNIGQKEKLRRVAAEADITKITAVAPRLCLLRDELLSEGMEVFPQALARQMVELSLKEMKERLSMMKDKRRQVHVFVDASRRYSRELQEALKLTQAGQQPKVFKFDLPPDVTNGLPSLLKGEVVMSADELKQTKMAMDDAAMKAGAHELKMEDQINALTEKIQVWNRQTAEAIKTLATAITPVPKKVIQRPPPKQVSG